MSSSSDSNVATTPPVPPSAEPSSSGSRLKRKRSDVESSYASSASSASLFSRRTKQKIVERNDGENCWHCGSGATDVAHVISKKDGSFSTYMASGLLTFDHLGDEQNGLPLCPSCHRAFDDKNSPGLIFIPIDLAYFIELEIKDYQSRMDVVQRLGHIPPRIVPSPQMYSEYLKKQEILPAEADGGLYWRYTLRKNFFPVNADKSFIPGLGPFKEPGVWCGAPMAALRRAFQVIGDPSIEGIPEDQLEQLWQLRKLYARKISSTHLLESTGVGRNTGQTRGLRSGSPGGQPPVTMPALAPAPDAVGPVHDVSGATLGESGHRRHNEIPETGASSSTARRTGLKSATLRKAESFQLVRFGREASTEVNVQRYVTMMMQQGL